MIARVQTKIKIQMNKEGGKRMIFESEEHKNFYLEKINEINQLRQEDVYSRSLIYTLGICETTREHFEEIFNMNEGEINPDAINTSWQTGTSAKVVRMAFSLWNRNMYDSDEDRINGKVSSAYNPSEIFCCSYAPYFYEGIKLRYPEYAQNKEKDEVSLDLHFENEKDYEME